MEGNEQNRPSGFKIMLLHGINIAITLSYVVLLFNHPVLPEDSSDIKFFTRFCLIVLIILMAALTIYDFKGATVRSNSIKVWKAIRHVHHIATITLFIIMFLSGYHSFAGYFLWIVSVPTMFFWTEMWAEVVQTREPKQIHPLIERIEMGMNRPLLEMNPLIHGRNNNS